MDMKEAKELEDDMKRIEKRKELSRLSGVLEVEYSEVKKIDDMIQVLDNDMPSLDETIRMVCDDYVKKISAEHVDVLTAGIILGQKIEKEKVIVYKR